METAPFEAQVETPPSPSIELAHLRIRVGALENLVAVLLADASDRQLELARKMAASLSEATAGIHPLTAQAAAQLMAFIDRSGSGRATRSSESF